jgi:hypothetical protein
MQVTYGDYTVDTDKLPEKSLAALIKRGLTHYLGNEQSSKTRAWEKAQKDEDGNEVEVSDEAKAAKLAECQAKAHAALLDGTVGTITRGPGKDPVEAEIERQARAKIRETLKANGIKFSGEGDERTVTLKGEAFTMDQLVERQIANNGEALRRDAEKALKAKAKRAESLKVENEAEIDL